MPYPQLREHLDQAVHDDCLQLTGHATRLHFSVCVSDGQALPPWATSRLMLRWRTR